MSCSPGRRFRIRFATQSSLSRSRRGNEASFARAVDQVERSSLQGMMRAATEGTAAARDAAPSRIVEITFHWFNLNASHVLIQNNQLPIGSTNILERQVSRSTSRPSSQRNPTPDTRRGECSRADVPARVRAASALPSSHHALFDAAGGVLPDESFSLPLNLPVLQSTAAWRLRMSSSAPFIRQ